MLDDYGMRAKIEGVILNFYPYYLDLLASHKKTTTLRLEDQTGKYHARDTVDITVGWEHDDNNIKVAIGKITQVRSKPIKELTKDDLEGESPDCRDVSAVKYVLSAIYRRIARDDDIVTIIKWKYV